jgi:predicted outer membrane repeat protein
MTPTKDGFGGGIYLNEGTLNLIGTRIEDNVASLYGAGLRTASGTTTIIRNSVFRNNTALGTTGDGGAIYNQGTMTITDSTFSVNVMGNGGAIANRGTLTIERSTIAGNLAYNNGGGLYNYSGGTTTLRNTTLDANFVGADNGSHIYNEGTLNLEHVTMEAFAFFGDATDVALYQQNGILNMSNTLISASQTTGGTTSTSCVFNAGTFATNVNNLIEDGTCSPALSGAPGLVDTDLADPDPAETSDNGGPTETIALDAAIPSQAIDAGASGSCLPTDQRGVARTAATCDIGAFEYTAVAAPVPSVTVASASATTLQEGTSVTIPVTVANLTSGQLQVYAVIEGGTASFTDDYTITDMLTFTTNGTQNITLNAVTDALVETGETVSVSFVLAGTADITGNGTQTITIIDPVAPPTFSKAFAPAIISTGGVTTLTYTIDNSANAIAATSLDFTHNLPTDVVVATPANASTTCTGGTLTAGAGTGVITYTGGAVTAGATCTVQADVTASSAGNFTNVTDDLTSSLGNSGTATDTLNVVPPPAFSMAFVPFSITVGNTSTLTHTIDNTASTIDATALDFTHNLPVDILIATPSNASTTCTGGTLTATDGGSVITYTGGTVTAGTTCTVQIDVTTNTIGNFDNTTGDLTSSLGNSGTANATLTVTALPSVGGGGGTSSDTSAGTPPEGFLVVKGA